MEAVARKQAVANVSSCSEVRSVFGECCVTVEVVVSST
jgi:hypothetical protein